MNCALDTRKLKINSSNDWICNVVLCWFWSGQGAVNL